MSYVVTNVTVTLLWLVFVAFNRTVVIGRRNVGEERNTLLLSNHQSMVDGFLVRLAAFYLRGVARRDHAAVWRADPLDGRPR